MVPPTSKPTSASKSGTRKDSKKPSYHEPPLEKSSISPPTFSAFHYDEILEEIEEEEHEEEKSKRKKGEKDTLSHSRRRHPQEKLTPSEMEICNQVGIGPKEFIELREVFRLVDKDGGGTISKDELQLLMQTLGLRISKEELEAMVNEIVADAEEIDLQSFIQAMSRKVIPSQPMKVLMNAFGLFDEGGYVHKTGRIKTKTLIHLLVNEGSNENKVKPEEVEDLISQIAPRALEDGFFDYDNYLSMLFSQ